MKGELSTATSVSAQEQNLPWRAALRPESEFSAESRLRTDVQPHISVVIPVYRAAGCLGMLYERLINALSPISPDFEVLLVEDGGPDSSWELIEQLCRQDPRIKGIKLSRNFGQHFAITAGLDHAFGRWVVVMDCDLQDQPEEISKLYQRAQEGHDVVFARRHQRQDSVYRKLTSQFFTWIYNYLGDIKADNSVANFSISSQAAIGYVRQFRERNRAFPAFLDLVGFRRAYVEVEHAARYEGKSSYTFSKLFDLAIQCIVAQSNKPLRLSIRFGFLLSAFSLIYGSYIFIGYWIHAISVPGWTSIMVLTSFLFGLMFANLGIIGLYLGKVFDEVKGRPLYMIERTSNLAPQRPATGHAQIS
jgi:polyisoprenyl-phosphate glycosyltransferase